MFKFLIFFGLTCIANAAAKQAISVTVYYEPLCPDSKAFFKNQLMPTYHDLEQSVDLNLKLIPFGKAKIIKYANDNITMECSHGPPECYADKIQACALKILDPKNNTLITYLGCLMDLGSKENEYPTKKCADSNNISPVTHRVEACATTNQWMDLVQQNEKETKQLSPPLTSVPVIVFQNTFKDDDNIKSRTNFKGVVCKYIDSPKPKTCEGVSSAPGDSFTTLVGGTILFLSLALNMLR
ncbi:GILT-like protein 1 [Cephus cinctus]|uniref:GILT-like protein 1 n=1 Tax=Cephus cinctus TaxID=211228 RepID=A0AAJ7C5W6_CEPCN|nr:GILT-like protein 1 [Cephus cinctus]